MSKDNIYFHIPTSHNLFKDMLNDFKQQFICLFIHLYYLYIIFNNLSFSLTFTNANNFYFFWPEGP